MFSSEYYENFKNTYFEKHLRTTATTTVNECSWMSLTFKSNIINFNLVETMQYYLSKQEIFSQLTRRTW